MKYSNIDTTPDIKNSSIQISNNRKKITIIGCGHGGLALAGHLAMDGHEVTLYASPGHPGALKEVSEYGKVIVTGQINGIGKIKHATSSIDTAVQGAEFIFVALPVIAHEIIFNDMLPFLKNDQVVINLSGRFSGIFQNEILKLSGCKKDIVIADTTTFPYACRKLKSCVVEVVAIKQKIGIAATNSMQTQNLIEKLQGIFPTQLEAKSSIVEIGFYDPSGISHAPNTIFNAGRIGKGEDFYFYKDGINEETAVLLNAMDQERLEIGRLLGMDLPPYYEVMNKYYGLHHSSILDFFKNSTIHNANKFCPTSLDSRYLTEEVPYSLVPWYCIGLSLGYNASATKSIIEIASALHSTDYMQYGRQLLDSHVEDYH